MSRESDETRPAETVAELRAEIDHTRHEIDQTMSEIEQRLKPGRLRNVAVERVREFTAPWREQPKEQAGVLLHELMARLREMAWMNPVGLGLGAVVVGYWLGRRAVSR